MALNTVRINNALSRQMLTPEGRGRGSGLELSMVIPILNEEENIEAVHEELTGVLSKLGKTYEVIYVDDGSTDATPDLLKTLYEKDPHVRVIRFRRNFGQTAAFSAGFDLADGNVIITMDGDFQNDPAGIPHLLEKLEEGYDVVSGWRVDRKDAYLTRRFPSQAANFMISRITGVVLHDYGCSLKAYRQEVLKNINLYGEMHRFMPALASWMGVRVAEIPVNHRPRMHGESKYGLGRIVKVFLDLVTVKFLLDYGTRPIQIFGLIGMFCFATGTALGIYLSIAKIFYKVPLADRPLLMLAVLMIVLGVQLITMGLLGELVVRVYYEAQNKPTYLVQELLIPESAGEQC